MKKKFDIYKYRDDLFTIRPGPWIMSPVHQPVEGIHLTGMQPRRVYELSRFWEASMFPDYVIWIYRYMKEVLDDCNVTKDIVYIHTILIAEDKEIEFES